LDRLKRERGLGKGIVVKEALAAYLKKLGVVARAQGEESKGR
jgi:hypothetical protein